MRLYSGFIGICCVVIGLLSAFLQNEIPPEDNIMNMRESILLSALGIVFMYIGREYLTMWISYFFGSDNSGDH